MAGVELCEGLKHAHEHGELQKLTRLELKGNRLGDATVNHLVNLVNQDGLLSLECLSLGSNAISDKGMASLASAVARGGLPSCTSIELGGNPGSAAPVQEALTQRPPTTPAELAARARERRRLGAAAGGAAGAPPLAARCPRRRGSRATAGLAACLSG